MTATPAWPPRSAPRLFVDQPLSEGGALRIEGNQAHYLLNVMRLSEGAAVKLFDDISGEYLGRVSARGKRDLLIDIEGQTRPREAVPDFWLCAAPIKKPRFDFLAEKACELGVARFVPVLTERAVVDKVKDDRVRGTMIEAAEQCERTALPEIAPLTRLDALLKAWPEGRHLFFADERLHDGSGVSFGRAGGGADRARGRLYRRRECGDPRASRRRAGLARPAHPARGDGGDHRSRYLDGGERRLGHLIACVLSPLHILRLAWVARRN